MEQKKYCGHTLEELKAMRNKHGRMFIVEVTEETTGEAFTAVCKEPTMEIMQAVQAASAGDELKATKLLFDNCVVMCDEPVKKRFILTAKVAASITEQLNRFRTDVKNV
jgi:hypothetical protein